MVSSNRLGAILAAWSASLDRTHWVLATVYKTEGSAYRKAGAWGLFNGDGQRFGLLSGGCLEADIQRQARRVMQSGHALTICYDASDEDDLSFQLGVGCGGVVHILLQPVLGENGLGLADVTAALQARKSGWYHQCVPDVGGDVDAYFEPCCDLPASARAELQLRDGKTWLVSPVRPEPHLLVVGGGPDAQPLVSMAKLLGWCVSLCDPRPANGRPEHFPSVDYVLRQLDQPLLQYLQERPVDAAVLMTHSVAMDAQALGGLQKVDLRYLALLGPPHRRREVLELAGLSDTDLRCPLHGPAGLDIGADLPESIALAILAEAHACLAQRDAIPLTDRRRSDEPLEWPPESPCPK